MSDVTFSQKFRITSPNIEFLDIPLTKDLKAFICPFLTANNRDQKIIDEVYDKLKRFLRKLNRSYIIPNDRVNGLKFLSHLHEPNEYHLGYSDENKGKAVSTPRSEIIFDALRNNRFVTSGVSVTNEAHNVLLLVKGIGQDIMSDIIANVCRDIFAQFTEDVCNKYTVPLFPHKIEYYNSASGAWLMKDCLLPEYRGKKIILLPKLQACGDRAYTSRYNWFIASNYLSADIVNGRILGAPDGLTSTLKDGTVKAIIKQIYKTYKKPKQELIDFVLKYQGSIDEFLDYAKEHYPELDLD